MSSMISVEGASKVFSEASDEIRAFEEVTFTVEKCEIMALVGASGCGKTTLLRCIAGLEAVTRGAIKVDGRASERVRNDGMLALSAQAPVLLPWRSVIENVGLPLEVRGGKSGMDPAVALRCVGLEAFASRHPHELSGGMRQRAAFARILVWAPSVLLLDEPFSALDDAARAAMNGELRKLRDRCDTTILLVTHSLVEAVSCSERVIVLSPRPGRVERVVDVDLPRERGRDVRSLQQFERALSAVRGALQ